MTIGIGILCKPPRPGLSKTRLAADIGSAAAARLAAAFLGDVVEQALAARAVAPAEVFCFVRPAGAASELAAFVPPDVPIFDQSDGDLGAIMRDAIHRMRRTCPAGAFVIGTDVPQISPATLATAARALLEVRPSAVIGPAADGGYYLIGLNDPSLDVLLDPLPWSTPDVFRLTEARARQAGVTLTLIDRLSDVDDREGLAHLAAELASLPESIARRTRKALCDLAPDLTCRDAGS